ncbi:MAG: ribosome silencing factor [Planctomycetota bacterium]|nr:ribosome silencing factor [Planctomycetota bacterium]
MDLARLCARMLSDGRAKDVMILDLQGLSPVTNYFVIATGTSQRQIRGIAEEIRIEMKRSGLLPLGLEGLDGGRWVLIDYADVVIHLMSGDARSFYDLEMLWGDAPKVEWES